MRQRIWVLMCVAGVLFLCSSLADGTPRARSEAAVKGKVLVDESGSPLSCLPRFGAPHLLLELPAAGNLDNMAAADFDGDGWPDVVLARSVFASPLVFELDFLLNDGIGLVHGTSTVFSGLVPTVSHPREIVLSDFNGDGRTDIFVADHGEDASPHPGYQNTLVLSSPGGKLVNGTAYCPQQWDFTHSAAAADIDGDGDVDLFVGNIWGQRMIPPQIWLNDGTGRFVIATGRLPARQTNLSETGYTTCLFVDVNNDGSADLILGDAGAYGGQDSVVLLNDGRGYFRLLRDAMPPKRWHSTDVALDIQAADINGDGYQDLCMAFTKTSYEGRYIQVFINNRNGTFRDETASRMPLQAENNDFWLKFLELIDLDYDGDADLVTWPIAGEHPLFYLNTGGGYFNELPPVSGVSPMLWLFLDLDGDGRRDILSSLGRYGSIPEGHYLLRDMGCPAAFLPLVRRFCGPEAAPTPVAPFAGVAQIYEVYNAMDGWGWRGGAEVMVKVTSSQGAAKDSFSIVATSWGNLPWTGFRCDLEEGDWITLILDQRETAFPVRMVRATADAETDTIVGVARCHALVTAMVEHPAGNYTSLETHARPDGSFSFDFSPYVNWEYGDGLWVGQFLNANGVVLVTEDSVELRVTPPGG